MSKQRACLKLKNGIAFLTLLLIGLLSVQSDVVLAQSAGLEIQWNTTYGSNGASSVIQTQDGGFAIAGANATRLTSAGYPVYDYAPLLIKINNSGEIEWIKSYHQTGGIHSIMDTKDSGYLLLGSNWLLKTDSQGNLQWVRTFYLPQTMGFTVVEDGNYVIVGFAENPATTYNYGVILKYNATGELLWQKSFNGSQIDVAATVILQSNDINGYYFAGSWDKSFWFVKLDSYGNIVWNQTYKFQEAAHVSPLTFHSIAQTQDNGYILGGTDGKYAWLVKTDSNGKEQWYQRYSYNNFVSVAQEKNGQYVALSNSQIIGMNSYGNELWNESFNDAENSESSNANSTSIYAASGILSNDGSLVVVGSVNYLINNTYNVWAAKFAPQPVPSYTATATPNQATGNANDSMAFLIPLIITSIAIVVVLGTAAISVYLKKRKQVP